MTHQHQTRWRGSRLAAVAGTLALVGLALAPAFAHPANAARIERSAAAPATVTIWDIQTGDEQKNLNAFAASFTKAHPSIRVQYQWYQNDPYKTKLAIAVGAHRGPDIFMGWGGGILQSYVKSGAVADLTSALGADPSWRSRDLPVVMKPVTFNGHVYLRAVPSRRAQDLAATRADHQDVAEPQRHPVRPRRQVGVAGDDDHPVPGRPYRRAERPR